MLDDFAVKLECAKLEAMKELAYGASHEINNPLANIAARAQALLRDEAHPERRHALEAIYQQAMRAHEMISDLMLFARPPALQLQTVDVGGLLRQATQALADSCASRQVRLTLQVPPTPVAISADAQQLLVAITAVCTNALEAIGTDGTLHVSLQEMAAETPGAAIEVTDTGPGISDQVRRHLFDPFFSGREAGRGLGFGMSKCWRIITDHGGTVTVHSQLGEGTSIALHLPADTLERQACDGQDP